MSRVLQSALFLAIVFLVSPGAAQAAQSFVYAVTDSCTTERCQTDAVLAYDTQTTALAARISIPAGRLVRSMATSHDGRLYLTLTSADGFEIGVIDLTRHQFVGTHSVVFAGDLTVSRDGAHLFTAEPDGRIRMYDTTTFALVTTITAETHVNALAASPVLDRLYTAEGPVVAPLFNASKVGEYDTVTGAAVDNGQPRSGTQWNDLHVSRDGTRVYATNRIGRFGGEAPGAVTVFDPATWATLDTYLTDANPVQTVDAVSRRRSYTIFTAPIFGAQGHQSGIRVRDFDGQDVATLSDLNPGRIVITADEAKAWVLGRSPDFSTSLLFVVDLATNTATRAVGPIPQPDLLLATTAAGASSCSYRLDTAQSPWTREGGSASIGLRTPCDWVASSDSSWARLSATTGSGDAALTLTVDPNPTTTTRTATLSIGGRLVTVTQAGPFTQAAFGFIDTPADNTTGISGAISVTGWALDDVGVSRVSVFRDPVAGEPDAPIFIGTGTFVDGARPDVAAVFPAFPGASRAGWGLQILTNALPAGGNGTYRLLVFADDTEGHTTLLGTRTFTASNATATIPFGNIDTPAAGQTVSGTIINFGWALTPPPAFIPSGSTIDVIVDGAVVGHPTYGFARSDIDTSFPGYMNSGAAVGYFVLDTRTLTNGLHTIAWVAHDNLGGTQGIGSRVFFVDNP